MEIPSSFHREGQLAKEALEQARSEIADCLHAKQEEIYFTSGGSEADNQAIRSAASIGARKGKKHIITSAFEHHAVLHTLDALKKKAFRLLISMCMKTASLMCQSWSRRSKKKPVW